MRELELTAHRGKPLPYLHGLDGLRAVAVLSVLFYHADARWMRGGYLGVEIFFVLSGYLITSGLRWQMDGAGDIDLAGFWQSRARRLFPALYTLLVATLVFSVLLDRTQVASLRMDALAAVGEVANWRFVFGHQSYFESFGRPPLLHHLWSLGIEEQFYLVWPPLFLLLASKLGVRRSAIVTGTAAVTSWALMALLFHPGTDPSRVYYGTDTRLGGILVGVTLALVWTPWRKPTERPYNGVTPFEFGGLAAFFLLLGCLSVLRDANPVLYRGGFIVVDLATALVIAATVDPGASSSSGCWTREHSAGWGFAPTASTSGTGPSS